jgi:hypothetical protein
MQGQGLVFQQRLSPGVRGSCSRVRPFQIVGARAVHLQLHLFEESIYILTGVSDKPVIPAACFYAYTGMDEFVEIAILKRALLLSMTC